MKKHLTIQNLLIVIASIYAITVIERMLDNDSSQTEIMRQHNQEYIQLVDGLDSLQTKIHNYEATKVQNYVDIIDMSAVERDSLRAVLNPR